MPKASETEIATFGAGCFWGVEETFRPLKGVVKTEVGYAGGTTVNPTYEDVCSHRTGHAEVVEITYDPSLISYEQLLAVFYSSHDPTAVNRQGPDIGEQYRSVIFTHTPRQREIARECTKALQNSGRFTKPIVTQILPAPPFYRAEEIHQQYLAKRGMGSCHL